MFKKHPLRTLCVLALAATATFTQAQTWPAKPLKIVVPFPAGGTSDAVSYTHLTLPTNREV